MVNGLIGNHGEIAQSRVGLVVNHDQERAQTQHQPMAAKIASVIRVNQENVVQMHVLVRSFFFKSLENLFKTLVFFANALFYL